MAIESDATVVTLHGHPAWAAAQRREAMLAEAMRRHPSYILRHGLATGSEDALAVVHEIGERRGHGAVAAVTADGHGDRHVVPLDEPAPAPGSGLTQLGLTQLADAIPLPFLKPLIEFWFPIAVGCLENLPRLMPRIRN